jgi:hypothetical protein
MLSSALATNIVTWAWIAWNIRPVEDHIFLHYNILFGVDLIGAWYKIYNFPALGLFILLINAGIGWIFFRNDKFVSVIFSTIALICQIIILIAALLIVFLNV